MPDTFQFTCPECGMQMNLPAATAGQQGACPGCKQVVTIQPDPPPVLELESLMTPVYPPPVATDPLPPPLPAVDPPAQPAILDPQLQGVIQGTQSQQATTGKKKTLVYVAAGCGGGGLVLLLVFLLFMQGGDENDNKSIADFVSRLPTHANIVGVLSSDGMPLADATVTFFPTEGNTAGAAARAASGKTDGTGKFSLTMNYAHGDEIVVMEGAPLGQYDVMITKRESPTDFRGVMVDPTADQIQIMVSDEYMSVVGEMNRDTGGVISEGKSLINEKFSRPYETPLRCSVVDGDNEFTIEINYQGQGTVR